VQGGRIHPRISQGEDQNCSGEYGLAEAVVVSSCLQDAGLGPRVAMGTLSRQESSLRNRGDRAEGGWYVFARKI